MLPLIKSENNDLDLTGTPTALSSTTLSTGRSLQCQLNVIVGDGSKNLAGSGTLTVAITLGGNQLLPDITASISGGRVTVQSGLIAVPSGTAISATVSSSDGGDTDVDVTAELYEVPTGEVIPFTVDTSTNNFTPTQTQFDTSLTKNSSDYYVGRIVEFRSGALAGQTVAVIDYSNVGGVGRLTVTPMTNAPSDGDEAILKL